MRVRVSVPRTLIGLAVAGLIGAALFPFAIYYIGLAVAPPRPVSSQQPVPPLLADAIWARAGGGQAAGLTPITPLSIGQFAACMASEDFFDTTVSDARRVEACRHRLPAIQGLEYLSNVHMRDAHYTPSFRTGISRFATTVWLTHSFSKAEFVRTLAERAEFSFGARGVDAGARLFLNRAVADLDLPQAALIAAMIGNGRLDPWCDPATAANMRRRVLERMRDDAVIDEAAFQSANRTELGLTSPPPDHQECAP